MMTVEDNRKRSVRHHGLRSYLNNVDLQIKKKNCVV